ncbi:hypothetical protein HanXRQr2_Chr13g0568471 [Helianthus annuus]|uniref:Uncharacterized protein n=1 Tax=Helianthus annuus TaxID=4232 RepID=A0A9K3EDR5_HELAN|nr:hypothetical protein HanXRQr2_Chr13g0568471 [Helianthus annuus]
MNACLIDVLFSSSVVVSRFRNWGWMEVHIADTLLHCLLKF